MKLFSIFCILLVFYETSSMPRSSCREPKIENGRYRIQRRGRLVKFVCNTGFTLAGDRYATCTGGKWDNPPPKCVRNTCKTAKDLKNGFIYTTFSGAVLYFYCKSGYQLNGPNVTYCDGTKWENNAPTCIPSHSKPALYCDFESEDLCGWTHDLNHDFDWIRMNYKTPSGAIGTGPSFDHTKGPHNNGYYMYIESSSRNENDTARLISPVYSKRSTDTCLEFWYHMYGASIGHLRVYIKKYNQPWTLDPKTAIFDAHGNKGDKWHRSFHELGIIDEDYQVIIEGVRGSSYVSDIAIDDVKIIEDCAGDIYSTTPGPDDFMTSEKPPILESCENACGRNNSGENTNSLIICDCDDGCIERNHCCPDYWAFCAFSGNTRDDFTYTETTEETIETEISSTPSTTMRRTTLTSTTSQKPTKKPIQLHHFTNALPPKQPVTKRTTTTTTTTTTRAPTTLTSKITIRTEPTLATLLPLNPVIPNDKIKKTESKVIYIKPENKDMGIIPTIKTTDIIEIINVTSAQSEKELENIKEKQINKKSSSVPVELIIFGAILGALFLIGGTVFILRRYNLLWNRRLRSFSNGESQSDVRFLANDEILDFEVNY